MKRNTLLFIVLAVLTVIGLAVSGWQQSPPKVPVCQAQMDQARRKIASGDRTENPLFEYVHGYYCSLALSGKADSRIWKTVKTPEGVLFIHKDFTKTELNRAKKARISMDAATLEQYLRENLAVLEASRKRSHAIATAAAAYLDPAAKRALDRQTPVMDKLLIAMPSYLDDPALWKMVVPLGDINKQTPSWLSMHEVGIILSSARKITDRESHDYITQAMQQSKSMRMTVAEAVRMSARHEGSHGAADAALIDLLKLKTDNPLYEGIASALASDSAVTTRTQVAPIELLNNPYPPSSDRRGNVAYYAGGKLWMSLYDLLKGSASEEQTWARLLGRAVSVASMMAADPQTFNLNDNDRISRYMSLLMPQLNISPDDFARRYSQLNQ